VGVKCGHWEGSGWPSVKSTKHVRPPAHWAPVSGCPPYGLFLSRRRFFDRPLVGPAGCFCASLHVSNDQSPCGKLSSEHLCWPGVLPVNPVSQFGPLCELKALRSPNLNVNLHLQSREQRSRGPVLMSACGVRPFVPVRREPQPRTYIRFPPPSARKVSPSTPQSRHRIHSYCLRPASNSEALSHRKRSVAWSRALSRLYIIRS
jgi:hypothetical protein